MSGCRIITPYETNWMRSDHLRDYRELDMVDEGLKAYVRHYPSGAVKDIAFYRKDPHDIHRDRSLPTYMSYHYKGARTSCQWYCDGLRHREDGPAWIEYKISNGRSYIRFFRYYFRGDHCTFWELYENVSKQNRKHLLINWLADPLGREAEWFPKYEVETLEQYHTNFKTNRIIREKLDAYDPYEMRHE